MLGLTPRRNRRRERFAHTLPEVPAGTSPIDRHCDAWLETGMPRGNLDAVVRFPLVELGASPDRSGPVFSVLSRVPSVIERVPYPSPLKGEVALLLALHRLRTGQKLYSSDTLGGAVADMYAYWASVTPPILVWAQSGQAFVAPEGFDGPLGGLFIYHKVTPWEVANMPTSDFTGNTCVLVLQAACSGVSDALFHAAGLPEWRKMAFLGFRTLEMVEKTALWLEKADFQTPLVADLVAERGESLLKVWDKLDFDPLDAGTKQIRRKIPKELRDRAREGLFLQRPCRKVRQPAIVAPSGEVNDG